MPLSPELKQWRHLLSDGFFLAFSSVYAYFITFIYERSYCEYFHVPVTLINPSFTTVLMLAVTVSAIAGSLYYSWVAIGGSSLFKYHRILKSPEKSWFEKLISGIFVFGLLYLFLWQTIGRWETTDAFRTASIIFGIIVSIYVLILFCIIPLLKRIPKKELSDQSISSHAAGVDFWSYLKGRYGVLSYFLPIIFILFLLVPAALSIVGFYEATTQTEFMFLRDYENYVVVRIYGDTLIATRINRNSKCLESDILLLSGQSFDKLAMHYEKFGSLSSVCERKKSN